MAEALRAEARDAVRHGFLTRKGGVSTGIYDSLNYGEGSADDPVAVAENRARVAGHFGVEASAVRSLHQVHSADVVVVRTALA